MFTPAPARRGLLDRIGIPHAAAGGLAAIVLFMIGDGIESTWLSTWLHQAEGFTIAQAGLAFTAYGIVVAVASFLSGALSDALGPRRVMALGAVAFLVFDLLFVLVALPSHSLALLVLLYGLRGLGYPLFAFGFLVWLMQAARPDQRSAAAGWFGFAFSLGIQIIGSAIASSSFPGLGAYPTLWIGLGFAVVGGALGVLLSGGGSRAAAGESVGGSLLGALTIGARYPRVGLAALVRVLSGSGPFALAVVLVPYLVGTVHLPVQQAILAFTVAGVFGIIGNLVWGFVGDAIGWRNCMQWFGAPLLVIGYVFLAVVPPLAGPSFAVVCAGMLILGAGISAFIPLTPLTVALAPVHESGAALALVNLGSGLAAFAGPAVAALLIGAVGAFGVIIALGVLNVVSFALLFALRLPGSAKVAAGLPDETVPAAV